MATLGIYTVKQFFYHEGEYYTYGGFGSYLREIRTHFEKVVLVAHVVDAPPNEGCYYVSMENTVVVRLPLTKGEHKVILWSPLVFWRCFQAAGLFDIAHARMPDFTGVFGAICCRLRGKPFFCQIIDDWREQAIRTPWRKRWGAGILMKGWLRFYDLCERLVCRNQRIFAQGESCYQKHLGPRTVHVISSAHKLADLVSPAERFVSKPYTILNVGRLVATKNQRLIIEALAILEKQGEGWWRLVILGAGPQEGGLRHLSAELQLGDKVTFIKPVKYGAQLWTYFDAADVFVLSSRSEGTPKVLLEAMARGTPVVATSVSGVPSVVRNEDTGLLFDSDDAAGLARSLQRIASDGRLRGHTQTQGVEFARKNTVEIQIEQTMDIVRKDWPRLFP